MTIYSHAGALPRHLYVHVQPQALGDHDWLAGVWFGLCSYPGRVWGCHVLLECGAVYRNVPLHQLAMRQTQEAWTPQQAQTFDCYGWQFSTLEYPYLATMNARARLQSGVIHDGQYLFTAVPIGDAFSASPDQAKEFYFIALDNDRITAQPTNHVLIEDRSFTDDVGEFPRFLRRQTQVWSCEDEAETSA